MTDDEWGGISDRIASTWPTSAGDPARYREAVDHLDPDAVEAALDDMLIEYRTDAPPPSALRERAEAVAPAEVAPFEPSAWDDEPDPAAEEPAGPPPVRSRPVEEAPRESARATLALILGAAGFVTIPGVVSVAAILVARSALAEIAADPGLGGERRARVGRALGFIGVGVLVLTVIVGVVVGLTD